MHCGDALPILKDDLIWEILLRLPVRTLVQLKCVCKSWKTLISYPEFAKDHLRTSMADQQLVNNVTWVTWESGFLLKFSVQELFQNLSTPVERGHFTLNGSYTVVGSCNGLLCLIGINNGDVILWNPSIRSIRSMSRMQLHDLPVINVDGWGFGYDHLNDRYKMLVVRGKRGEGENMTTKLYTFGPNYWTVIPNFPYHSIDATGNFLNGTLHWIVTKTNRKVVILSFDLGTEKYGELLLPDEQDTHKFSIPVLDVLRNSLCVSFLHSTVHSGNVHVWLMKDYGVEDSWIKLMIIPQFHAHYERFFRLFFQLLNISEDGVLLFKTPLSRKLILYNSNDKRFDYLICGHSLHRLFTYRESLVSPKML